MSKVVKRMMINSIQGALGECREVLVLDASKLNAVEANKMRNTLRKKQITLLGVKNAVARRALSEIGLTGAAGSPQPTVQIESPKTLTNAVNFMKFQPSLIG